MLYIVSQKNTIIADLRTISVMDPAHDLEDDGVYKVFVNGIEFAKYQDKKYPDWIMKEVQKFIHMNGNSCFRLPKDGEDVWNVRP